MPDQLALSMPDVQPKTGPALSATSDMPEVKAAPPAISEEVTPKPAEGEKAEEIKVEAKPEAEGEKPADEKKADAEGDDETAEAELPPKFKAQITRQRGLKRAAEARAVAAETKANEATANLTKALESIDSLTKAQAASISESADKADPRPNRETYDDPNKYEADLVDWAGRRAALVAKADVEKAVQDQKTKDDKAANDKVQAESNKKVADEFAARKDKFIETHPDYADVAEAEDLQISMAMAAAIINDEDGPAIAYYLGQNPDEAERISKLSGPRALTEIGRIAARLASKPAPSTKPAPLKTLKSASEAAVRKTPAEESMEEYGARRQREIANSNRSRMGLAPLN